MLEVGAHYRQDTIQLITAERALTERAAEALLASSPFVRCFPCLAIQLRVTERTVRDAAQIMVWRDDFGVERRPCYDCNRIERVLIGQKK